MLMNEAVKHAPTLDELRMVRDDILKLAEKYGAYNVRVFGSVARGDATAESDVDFLVQFREGVSIFDEVGFWLDLKELLQREVNLSSDDTLKEYVRSSALRDAVPL
jgi:uncharacterized protein